MSQTYNLPGIAPSLVRSFFVYGPVLFLPSKFSKFNFNSERCSSSPKDVEVCSNFSLLLESLASGRCVVVLRAFVDPLADGCLLAPLFVSLIRGKRDRLQTT